MSDSMAERLVEELCGDDWREELTGDEVIAKILRYLAANGKQELLVVQENHERMCKYDGWVEVVTVDKILAIANELDPPR